MNAETITGWYYLILGRLCLAKTKSAFEINNIKKGM
jgi:hypothetical protein